VKRIVAPALLFVVSATLLIQLPIAIADRSSAYDLFDPIVDVRRILLDRYVEPVDEVRMQQAMIDGMIETLDDPYTQYVPPAKTADFNKQLRGTYAGIGAEVNFVDGYLTIVTPMDDSPALRGGILAGDVVLDIDGVSTYEERERDYRRKLDECIEYLTGESGTPVTLKVRHLDGSEEDLEIVRGRIVTRTVKGLRRDGEHWSYCVDHERGLSYVRVTQFNATTVEELATALEALPADQLNGLILDLRDNPGGGLPGAIGMSDLFLDGGTIVSIRPRVGDEVKYSAHRAGTLGDFPLLILVNRNSASASEIVSGALQDNGRAKVMGTRTYGKGSVQEVRPLKYDGGTLKFTTAHYYLPSGRNIHRAPGAKSWGVDPDPGLVYPVADKEYFEMLRARREFEIIRDIDDTGCLDAEWIRGNLLDDQLAAAVEALGARVSVGEWPVLTDDEPDRVAFEQELQNQLDERLRLYRRLGAVEQRIDEIQVSAPPEEPLLPEGVDLSEGTITIRDKSGEVIGTYRLEGGNLELALRSLTLESIDEP